MSTTDRIIPDWLVPGTEVVLYSTGGVHGDRNVKRSTIHSVGRQWVRVSDPNEPRIRIDTLRSPQQGSGVWSSYTRRMVPVDSPEGRAELAVLRRDALRHGANRAVHEWQRLATPENLRKAIKALRALEDDDA